MKRILADEIEVIVSSDDFRNGGDFYPLHIEYKRKGGDVQTGTRLDLASLEDSTGFAYVNFRLNKVSEIPYFAKFMTDVVPCLESISIKNCKVAVLVVDQRGEILLRKESEVDFNDDNLIELCDFDNLTEVPASIWVEIVSFELQLKMPFKDTNFDDKPAWTAN